MGYWFIEPSDPSSPYPKKWIWKKQLMQPLSNWLEQPFTWAACPFDDSP